MILPLIAREAEAADRETERFAAWTAAFRNLSQDWRGGVRLPPLSLGAYLDRVPAEQREAALEDLVAGHLRLSWEVGLHGHLLRDYGPRFADDQVPAWLVEEEFLARALCRWGTPPSLEEYVDRFRGRPEATAPLRERLAAGGRLIRLRRLGQGALGEVWEAYDRQQQHAVALKIPLPGTGHDPAVRDALLGEAAITSRLDHPSIVKVLGIPGPGDPEAYLIYQLSRDPRLSDLIRPGLPAAARPPLLRSLEAVCRAIEHAHFRGLIHRDLKPGNVLSGLDETMVIDWSLARPPGTRERSGTPEYMPPERLDAPADPREDVYGLGAILYEILTGRPPCPWTGPRPADWAERIRRDPFPAPRRLNAAAPRALEALCLRALSRDPDARPANARRFRLDLAGALEELLVHAWGRRLWRWLTRPPA